MKISIIFVVFSVFCFCNSQKTCTVFFESGKFTIKTHTYDPSGACRAQYYDFRKENGWEILNITSSPSYDDSVQAFGSGFAEGYLTAKSILETYKNYVYDWGGEIPLNVTQFVQENYNFVNENVKKFASTDQYWRQIELLMIQFKGILNGYNKYMIEKGQQEMSILQLYLLNSAGDLFSIMDKYKIQMRRQIRKWKITKEYPYPSEYTHCSALIKYIDDDLLTSHVTWRSFNTINKMFKFYNINYKYVASSSISLSSSPGFLSSLEDLYITSSNIVITETTNGIYDLSLYNKLTPNSLFYWMRITIANQLGESGVTWRNIFQKYYSGTYTNQWMIVDYNLFQRRIEGVLPDNTLIIFSEIPGLYRTEDVTRYLNSQNFWPSYNNPYFKDIYNITGYYNMYMKYGDVYSYEKCPRARIFNEEAGHVNSIDSLKKLMQYNDYKNDPRQLNDPSKAIAARYDLRSHHPDAFGATDCKIVSKETLKKMGIIAYAGPTKWNDDTPPFNWNDWKDKNITHEGQPEKFDFDWIEIVN